MERDGNVEENDHKMVENDIKETGNDHLDIEPLLQALGRRGLGLYQILQMVLHLASLFGVAFSVLSVVFIGYKPKYRCADVNSTILETLLGLNESFTGELEVTYGQCSIDMQTNTTGQLQQFSLPCVEGFHYEEDKHKSFFTEWDLTCEKSALTELTQTLLVVGQAIGAFSLTSLADRLGRKPVFVTCSILRLVVATATGLSPNYYFFLVCRVLMGALQQGSGLVGYTMFIELLPKRLRGAAGVIDGGVWSLAVMLLPALAFLMQHYSWRHLQFVFAAFSAYSLILPCFVDESLRWLVANKKKKEVERVLKKACRMNGVQYHTVHAVLEDMLNIQPTTELGTNSSPNENVRMLLDTDIITDVTNEKSGGRLGPNGLRFNGESSIQKLEMNDVLNEKADSSCKVKGAGEKLKKYSILDVMKSKVLLKTTFIIAYLWVANSLTYYGLMLTSASLAGNRFLSFFLQAAMEFPAFFTVFLCLRRFGRRNVTSAFLVLTSVSLILSSTLLLTVSSPVVGPITNVLSMLGKYAVSGSFCAIFILCPELYPTNLRTAGLGTASTFARLGGMIAPYANNLAAVALWAPGYVFGGMTMIATYFMLQLPETRGLPMPTTIQEMEARHRAKASKSKPANRV